MIFDSWTMYGPGPGRDSLERWKLEDLLDDMDFYGIAGALVRHEQGYHYDPMFVNRMLSRELSSCRERLFPCWLVSPHQPGDFPEPGELGKLMEGEDIRAVWMMPSKQGYPVHGDILNPLAEYLNGRKIPILLSINDISPAYENLLAFCRIFHRCPVIFGEVRWANYWRLMTAVMDACPNAFLEFHKFQGNRGVEVFSERYGVERLMFGSGLLRCSAGAARGFVDFSFLDRDKVELFAGKNLAKILGKSPVVPVKPPRAGDIITESVRIGKPVPVPVIDAHCHVLHKGLNGIGSFYLMPRGDIQGMLEMNRRIGIDMAAVMSWAGPVGRLIQEGNEVVTEAVDASPREVIGVSTCNPVQQTEDEIKEMCRHLHLELGFRGLKPYHAGDPLYTDRLYAPYWEFCNRYALYGLLHVQASAAGVSGVEELAAKYPEATFLVAHSCTSWHFAKLVAEAILKYPNIMAEITHTSVPNGIIEWLCATAGAGRVIFGSDASMRDPRPQLSWCVYTRLGIREKERILGGNFAGVLKKGRLASHSLPLTVDKAFTEAP